MWNYFTERGGWKRWPKVTLEVSRLRKTKEKVNVFKHGTVVDKVVSHGPTG